MNDRLHPLLILLTLLDLGFVHATGAVAAWLLLPMWLLAIASPRLRRWQRFRVYRHGWNTGVLIVFALLVHHATTTGLLHMLEDGLVLAVLCQVHLLNNVGERQRPDLTFFNSFLIAFVTSFFAPDFWWSLLFAAHTFAFVPALQVYVLTSRAPDVDRQIVRRVLRDSLPRTAIISAITALAFVFWPRDFKRTGWLRDHMAFGQQLQAGLADRVDIGNEHATQLSDAIALRIEMVRGQLTAVPSHWRAKAFSEFDGRTWSPQEAGRLGSRFASDTQWERQPNGNWRRPSRGQPHTTIRVQQFERTASNLTTTLAAVAMQPLNLQGCMLDAKSFAGFATIRVSEPPSGPLTYTVDLAQPQPSRHITLQTRGHFVALPERGVPNLAYSLGRQLAVALPKEASDLAMAQAACDWLQDNRRYQLPGKPGFAGNFGEFLLGTAAGHCEYFATALALILRTQGVPCRLIGGYLVHERSEDGKAMIARDRDAHAWLEVLAADGSWHTFDATPPADVRSIARDDSGAWSDASKWLQSLWAEVTGFDEQSRKRWLSNLATLPTRHPIGCTLFAAIATLLLWRARRRRRTRTQRLPTIANFERALHLAQLTLQPGETPRELLLRAGGLDLRPEQLSALQATTQAHEQARYGAQQPDVCTVPGSNHRPTCG